MRWEVHGTSQTDGRELTLLLEADTQASAIRRGERRGLAVAWARSADAEPVEAAAPANDSVGYVYTPPAYTRRKKSNAGAAITVAIVAVVVAVAGWGAYVATRPTAPTPIASALSPATPAMPTNVKPAPTIAPVSGSPTVATPTRTAPLVPAANVSADALIAEVATDPKKAATAYQGQVFSVQGQVVQTDTNLFGAPCVTLRTTSSADLHVQCTLTSDQADAAAALHAGDSVKIVGRYDGLEGVNLQLVGCQLPRPSTPANSPTMMTGIHP